MALLSTGFLGPFHPFPPPPHRTPGVQGRWQLQLLIENLASSFFPSAVFCFGALEGALSSDRCRHHLTWYVFLQ